MALTKQEKQYIRKSIGKQTASDIAEYLKKSEAEVAAFIQSVLADKEKSNRSTNPPHIPLTTKKKLTFTLIALSIPLLFFVLLETGLRLGNYMGNTRLFMTLEQDDGLYSIVNPRFASRYFFYTTVVPNPPLELFYTQKPDNAFRVFVMGESSAAGYPYGFNGVPGRVVRDVLQDAMPDKTIEVITVATSAINSYTLYDQVDEILQQKPDAILIYTGHNEFYGALGAGSNESLGNFPAFVRFYLRIQRLKTFLLLREQITNLSKWIATRSSGEHTPGLNTLMQQVVRDQAITLDSPVYELGKRQFRSNMTQILRKFERAEVPVFLGSLASNLRDHAPFESIATQNHPDAAEVFEKAQRTWQSGDFNQAKQDFVYARDLDALKFRATSDFNDIIRDLSGDFSFVTYVPVKEHLSSIALNGVIGFDLMLEHLHPNDRGYFEIGWLFAEAFLGYKFSGFPVEANLVRHKEHYFRGMHLTELDHYIVRHRLLILTRSWPFVREADRNIYRGYVFSGIADSLAQRVVANQIRWDEAKVAMADYHLERGEIDLMLTEYRGLMRDQPYNETPFLVAAQQLLDRNRLDDAYPYLQHAHRIVPSAFTYKMIGAIYVDRGQLALGAEMLEESLRLRPGDAQAMFNLSGAYAQMGDLNRALSIVEEIMRVQPTFPGLGPWRDQLQTIIRQRQP
jgi:tetratricopeptide (TPR) repeat protein